MGDWYSPLAAGKWSPHSTPVSEKWHSHITCTIHVYVSSEIMRVSPEMFLTKLLKYNMLSAEK